MFIDELYFLLLIGQNIAEVEKRTEQFRRFIDVIEKAIKSIGKDSPIKALETLKTISQNSRKLISDDTSNG